MSASLAAFERPRAVNSNAVMGWGLGLCRYVSRFLAFFLRLLKEIMNLSKGENVG